MLLLRRCLLFIILTATLSHAQEVFIDSKTGLEWQDSKSVLNEKRKWNDAKKYCKELNLYGYSDWRLPTTKELNYALKNITFTHSSSQSFWTDSQFTFLPFDPWKAQSSADNDICCSNSKVFTRCVRNN